MIPSGQVTIKDIARELNISPSTVSRALKDHPDISPSTKLAVNDLAKKLKYQPNSIALSLRKNKTDTIGIIIPEIVHFFFSTVISGIEDIAYEHGYNVIISQSNESYEREIFNTKAMLSHRVDGLLVSVSKETKDFSHFQELQDRGIPIVFFDRISEKMEASCVVINDFQAAFDAVEHLISQGKKRIAHIYGDQNLLICKQRYAGYKAALEKYNLPADESLTAYAPDLDFDEVRTITGGLLDAKPDGLFAHNDMVAYGAMMEIKHREMAIPDDIAIIGFSNWRFSSLVEPGLSSMSQSGYEMGQEAALLFMEQLEKKDEPFEPIVKTLDAKLVIRGSTSKNQK